MLETFHISTWAVITQARVYIKACRAVHQDWCTSLYVKYTSIKNSITEEKWFRAGEKSAKDRESQVGPELQRVASRKELDGLRDGLRPQALEDGERERTVGERRGRRGAHPAVAAWLGEVGALPEMPVDLESLRTTLDPFTGGIGISGE